MRKVRTAVVVSLFALIAMGATCQSPTNESALVATGKVLVTLGYTYDSLMRGIASAHESGLVSDSDVLKAIEIGRKFVSTYNAALSAWTVWETTRSAEAQVVAQEWTKRAQVLVEDLGKLAQSWGIGGK
ncbi:MAG: hypothetical protein QXT73_00660 [Candidatus Methanomethylicaceae archaeon]